MTAMTAMTAASRAIVADDGNDGNDGNMQRMVTAPTPFSPGTPGRPAGGSHAIAGLPRRSVKCDLETILSPTVAAKEAPNPGAAIGLGGGASFSGVNR